MRLRAIIFVSALFISGITSTEASFIPPKASPVLHPHTYETLTKEEKKQVDCLAKNIYYESVGEPYQGRLAVAAVTMNRINSKDFPSTICEVVFQKVNGVHQFSWTQRKRLYSIDPETYNSIRKLAVDVYFNYNSLMDNTDGALYFHTAQVQPQWRKLKRVKKIGGHIFYKDPRGNHASYRSS